MYGSPPHLQNNHLDSPLLQNSLLSSLPYLTGWAVSFPYGYISDTIINKKWVSVSASRKIFNSFGTCFPLPWTLGWNPWVLCRYAGASFSSNSPGVHQGGSDNAGSDSSGGGRGYQWCHVGRMGLEPHGPGSQLCWNPHGAHQWGFAYFSYFRASHCPNGGHRRGELRPCPNSLSCNCDFWVTKFENFFGCVILEGNCRSSPLCKFWFIFPVPRWKLISFIKFADV